MLYPEFRCAKIDSLGAPSHFPKHVAKRVFVCLCHLGILLVLCSGLTCLLRAILNPESDNYLLDLLSISASFITIFAAFVAAISLLDALFMRKYEEDLHLLEERYLEGKKLSSWDFFKRYSNAPKKSNNGINYILISATYMLYVEDTKKSLEILVPILAADFYDVSCIKQIIRIRKFLPIYQKYLEAEEVKYLAEEGNKGEMSPKRPFYYFPLPQHLIALYKNILAHKICKILLIYFSILMAFAIGIALVLAI